MSARSGPIQSPAHGVRSATSCRATLGGAGSICAFSWGWGSEGYDAKLPGTTVGCVIILQQCRDVVRRPKEGNQRGNLPSGRRSSGPDLGAVDSAPEACTFNRTPGVLAGECGDGHLSSVAPSELLDEKVASKS